MGSLGPKIRTGAPFSIVAVLLFLASGCVSYITPGGPADLAALVSPDTRNLTEPDIQKLLERRPIAPFPARLAVVRIQAPNYSSNSTHGFGSGRYSVVTTREIEREEDFTRLSRLPMVAGVAPLNRILLPSHLETDKELRMTAASLQADLVLVYTLDTVFRISGTALRPFSVFTLGILPSEEAEVTSTASAALFDVRTGFVYGIAESTAKESQYATLWTSQSAVDSSRFKAETKAFGQLLDEFEKTWKGVLEKHASNAPKKSS